MNTIEKRTAFSLSLVFACRMLGLFMVLPVLSTYGSQYEGATTFLLGLAVGVYGLSQAILQIPFGYLSDKFGRKPLIFLGLSLFALGSLVAANAESIWLVIIGRFLQGSGAIASVIMALASDLTRDEQRSKVMAFIGSSIGAAFLLAMVLGPLISGRWGLPGLFYLTSLLAIFAIGLIAFMVPTPLSFSDERSFKLAQLPEVLKQPTLLQLNFAIFALHLILTAFFVAVPKIFQALGTPTGTQSMVYGASMFLSLLIMLPTLIVTEKKRQHRLSILSSVGLIGLSATILALFSHSFWLLCAMLCLFFAAFNILEASLPSLISRIVPVHFKGSALGVYSSSQFFGAFFGGILGGLVLQHAELKVLFLLLLLICLVWIVVCWRLENPPQVQNLTLSLKASTQFDEQLERSIRELPGVREAIYVKEENLIYVKAFEHQLSMDQLKRLPFVATVS